MTEARTRHQMEEDFLNITKAQIEMGQYDREKPIVIVEGILDSKVFAKIRTNELSILSIDKLIQDTLRMNDFKNNETKSKERANLTKKHGVKDFVKQLCELFIENGFSFVFGIQDADKDGINNLISSGSLESKNKESFLFQTLPSRDMEMLLYSKLKEEDRFETNFPRKFAECTERANQLAYTGLGLVTFNKMKVIKGECLGLNKFSRHYNKQRKAYFELCKSTDLILEKFVDYYENKFNEDSKKILISVVRSKKEQLINLNLHWSSLGRGHDLEKLLEYTNSGWKVKSFNELMITLLDYSSVKNHKMFQSIEDWRKKLGIASIFRDEEE